MKLGGPAEQGKIGLWLTNTNGTERQLLPTVVVWSKYAWSPDGRVLAYDFCSEGKGSDNGTGIRLYSPLDGSTRTLKAVTMPDQYGCEPQYLGVWSPNSRYLALDLGTYVIRAIKIVDVAADKLVASFSMLAYRGMAFSPDGSKLAIGLIEVDKEDRPYNPTVTILHWATGRRQVVVQGKTEKDSYETVAWLADGRLLYKRYEQPSGKESVWTIIPGTNAEPQPASNIPLEYDSEAVMARIPEGLRSPYARFSFSPDKTWLAFEGKDGNRSVIHIMSWKTGELIGSIADGSNPAWQPKQ